MNEVIKNSLMYELVFKILNMSITATFMALAVIFLRLLLRRAPKWISYALWGVVLFRLVCPFSFSSEFSLLGGIGAPSAESGVVSYIPENLVHTATPQVNMIFPGVNETINSSLPQGEEQLVADPLEAPAAMATCLWLLGVAAMLVYSVTSYVLLKRRLSDATLLEGNVFETDAITSPFVCGLIKPRIYLPVGLPVPERGYVLLHERTHIRRRDYLVKPLAFLALSTHWFNPVMWLSFRLMCRDMEMSCDERV
ncbi:MAG: M56 family metallopeptidase, partial [Lawsonibacter sp.]|nr:M56 family metallopeptidase [Lawsonibacter sp.]